MAQVSPRPDVPTDPPVSRGGPESHDPMDRRRGGDPAGRWGGSDLVRVLACIGIVQFHMRSPYMERADGPLLAFGLLTVAFAAQSAQRSRSLGSFAASRVRRLLVPWVFWSVAYGALNVVMAARHGRPLFGWAEPKMLLIGTKLHLWYLPFAFAASLAAGAYVIARRGKPQQSAWAWAELLLIGVVALVLSGWLVDRLPASMPIPQWLVVAPAVPLGLAFAAIGPAFGAGRPWVISVLALGLVASLAATAMGIEAIPQPQAAVALVCALLWSVPWKAPRVLTAAAQLTMGIYLLHPFFILIMYRHAPEHVKSWTGLAAVVLASGAATWAMRQTRLREMV
jgi:peptidoglycan/LPS O-acetylase OafA/YrhL